MSVNRKNPLLLREAAKVLNRIADLLDQGCTNQLALNCLELAVAYFESGEQEFANNAIKQAEEALRNSQ
jgi:hypothetical protein